MFKKTEPFFKNMRHVENIPDHFGFAPANKQSNISKKDIQNKSFFAEIKLRQIVRLGRKYLPLHFLINITFARVVDI